MKRIISVLLCLLLGFSICAPAASAISIRSSANALRAQYLDGMLPDGSDYVWFSPVKNSLDSHKYPLLIWLHGAENCKDERDQISYFDEWNLVSDEYQARMPGGGFFIFAPRDQGTLDTGWDPADTRALKQRIDAFVEKFEDNIDTDRIYLAGYSAGGSIIWNLLNLYPNYFAAVCPIAALNQPSLTLLSKLTDVSVWFFSSDLDANVFARSNFVKNTFTSLKEKTKRPTGVRITTFSHVVLPDGSLKDADSPSFLTDRCIWYAFTNDMHMYNGAPYANQTTVDAAGNYFDFNDGSGIISWLSAQTRSGVVSEEPEDFQISLRLTEFLRMLLDRLLSLVFSIFNPSALSRLANFGNEEP